jgi:tetratricopeptide (TPR) repeat protein
MYLADVLQLLGELEAAEQLYEHSIELLRAVDSVRNPYALRRLACLALRRGDARGSAQLYLESLAINRQVGERQGSAASLIGLAEVANSRNQVERAARLVGAADALLADLGSGLLHFDQEHYERSVAALRASLGDAAFASFRQVGEGLSVQEVTVLADGVLGASTEQSAAAAPGS